MQHATMTSHKVLFCNTLAFTVCFAVWMLNGVLITFLTSNQIFDWGAIEIGWLMGTPVLTGAIFRLPAGILTDKFGGKPIFTLLLIFCAIPMFLLSYANSLLSFILCGFGFGMTGAGFAIGIAYSAVWYPKKTQGTALGIFGAGNAGAGLTSAFAPTMLNSLTEHGKNLEGWRTLPKIYAGILIVMAIIFFIFTVNKKPKSNNKNLLELLKPLKKIQIWRFGLCYFLVFGCFVSFANWLVPYYVNVYSLPLVTAGILAAAFSIPSGVIRALGGVLSDLYGPRIVMYWVLITSVVFSAMLTIPRMEIFSPGRGIMAKTEGTVEKVTPIDIIVSGKNDWEKCDVLLRLLQNEN